MADTVLGHRQYDNRSSRVITNVNDTLILLDKDLQEGNWLTFYMRTKAKVTRAEEYKWDVDALLTLKDTTSAAVSDAADTVIPVNNVSRFNVGEIIMCKRTGEHMRVEAVNTGSDNLTVTRQITALSSGGGTAAAALVSGDTLIILGPAVGEDNRRQTPQHTIPNEVTNYTQAMRWEISASRRQIKRSFESQDEELPWLMMKAMLEARRKLNATFLAGEKGRYTDSVQGDITFTQGIRSAISTRVFNVNGTLYQANFNSFLATSALRVGMPNKLCVASMGVILAITEMATDLAHFTLPMNVGKTKMGIQVLEYMAPNGRTLTIVEDRFLTDHFDGEALIVDMSQLKRRVFSNHGIDDELHVVSDTGDVDDFGTTNSLYCDMGLEYGDETAHAKLTNVSGGAKGRASA